jgi:uncharacterized protein (TIGR00725 family)
MKRCILVIGYGSQICTEDAYWKAYEVGYEIASKGHTLVTGGKGGVMEGASRGAKDAGGSTIGIVGSNSKLEANRFCDIVIPTGVGEARNFITSFTADAVIVVGGGVGTLIEACVAYIKRKPIIALKGSGGIADKIAGKYLDERQLILVQEADDPSNAVRLADQHMS